VFNFCEYFQNNYPKVFNNWEVHKTCRSEIYLKYKTEEDFLSRTLDILNISIKEPIGQLELDNSVYFFCLILFTAFIERKEEKNHFP